MKCLCGMLVIYVICCCNPAIFPTGINEIPLPVNFMCLTPVQAEYLGVLTCRSKQAE